MLERVKRGVALALSSTLVAAMLIAVPPYVAQADPAASADTTQQDSSAAAKDGAASGNSDKTGKTSQSDKSGQSDDQTAGKTTKSNGDQSAPAQQDGTDQKSDTTGKTADAQTDAKSDTGKSKTPAKVPAAAAAAASAADDISFGNNNKNLFKNADGQWQFSPDVTKKGTLKNPLSRAALIHALANEDNGWYPKVTVTVDGKATEYTLNPWDIDFGGFGGKGGYDYQTVNNPAEYKGTFTIYLKPGNATLPAEYAQRGIPVLVKFDEHVPADEKTLEANRISTLQPANTTVNLFDYWLQNQDSWDYNDDDVPDIVNAGINKGHSLRFRRWGGAGHKNPEDSNPINKWSGDSGEPYRENGADSQGMVSDKLAIDGYPTLTKKSSDADKQGGNPESLNYLFDDSKQEGKASYKDVKNLFKVENGYYTFDSNKNYAEYDQKENAFHVYNKGAISAKNTWDWTDKDAGKWEYMNNFFPFNKASDVFKADGKGGIEYDKDYVNRTPNSTTGDGDAGVFSENAKVNHYFGMTMETRFTQKYHGHTNSNENDTPTDNNNQVKYDFSGDDDVWVYIDGVLVADLGGIHNRDSFSINFATGKVNIGRHSMGRYDDKGNLTEAPGEYSYESTTLKKVFEKAGVNTSNFDGDTLPNNTSHTLKFFYMERGNTDSNCSLSFNLIDIPDNSVKKIDQYGNPVKGAGFEFYSAYDDYTIDAGQIPFTQGSTDANGVFGLVDPITGDPRSLAALRTSGVNYILVKESKVPDGYRRAGTQNPHIEVVTKTVSGGDYTYLKSMNSYQSGSQVVTGLDVSLTGGGNTVACGASQQCDLTRGTMFAIVMKHKTNADGSDAGWFPVTGDTLHGWKIWDNPTQLMQTPSVIKQQIASRDNTGNWHLKFDELPGDVEDYAFMDGKKYSINYYYTTDKLADGVTDYTPIAAGGLSRELSSTIYVSDILNTLAVQKLDEKGTPFKLTDDKGNDIPDNHAEFSLYKDDDIVKNDDHKPTGVKDGASAYATMTTRDYLKSKGDLFDKKSSVVFSGLPYGTYYVKETKAPKGYGLNSHWTKVVVNDNGVFADAGIANDNVKVQMGLGSVVKSLYPTVDGIIDKSLTNLTVGLKSATSTDMGDELNKEGDAVTKADNTNKQNTAGDKPNYLYGQAGDLQKATQGTYPSGTVVNGKDLSGQTFKETETAHYSHFPTYWLAKHNGDAEAAKKGYIDYVRQDPDEAMSSRWLEFLTGTDTSKEPHAQPVKTKNTDTVAHLSYHGLSSDAVFEYSPTRAKDTNGNYIKNGKYDADGKYIEDKDGTGCKKDNSCEYKLAYDDKDANYPDAFTADDDFSVDEGFPMLSVTQNYEDKDHGVSSTDKQDLKDTELSGLFSGLTTIQVTDRGFSPLKISNVVVNLNGKKPADGTLPNPNKDAKFGFTITLKAGKDLPDVASEYDYKLCSFDGTDPTNYATQTCEPGKKTLNLKPAATTTSLWKSIVRLFAARRAAAEATAYSGTLELEDGQIAVFDELPETTDYTMTETDIPLPFYQIKVEQEDGNKTTVTQKDEQKNETTGVADGTTAESSDAEAAKNRHAHFVNTFGVEAKPGVTKKVTGKDWPGTDGKNFTFDLTRTTATGDADAAKKVYHYKDGDKTAGKVEELPSTGLTASTNGKIETNEPQTVNFPDLVFNDTGTYTFKVAEKTDGKPDGWKYDTTNINDSNGKDKVTVKVEQKQGYEPKVTLTYGTGSSTTPTTFVNQFATVSSLPLTGGDATARTWLLIGGGLLACALAVREVMRRKRGLGVAESSAASPTTSRPHGGMHARR